MAKATGVLSTPPTNTPIDTKRRNFINRCRRRRCRCDPHCRLGGSDCDRSDFCGDRATP
jgi:hypothetical protein